jgi:hypothetical protein
MSSSFRSPGTPLRAVIGGLAVLACAGASHVCQAQQLYFVPAFSARGEYDTNRALTPNGASSAGYSVLAEGFLKRLTLQTDMILHPQISYGNFPQLKRMNRVAGLLDLNFDHRTQRSELALTGQYSRQDTLNAQFGHAAFIGPIDNPNTDVTGVVTGGITQTRYTLDPGFFYQLTKLNRLETELREDKLNYSSSAGVQNAPLGYEFHSATVKLIRQFTPRLHFGAGPSYSHFESDNHVNKSDGYGVESHLRYEWSQITRVTVQGSVERDRTHQQNNVSGTSTAWSLFANGTTKLRLGSLRYSVGRFIEPSNVGSRTTLDQFRFEYLQPLSERWNFDGAASYGRLRIVGPTAQDQTARDRANAELRMNYLLSPTLTLSGGYQYASLDVKTSTGLAKSNGVFLTLSYKGLDPHDVR